MWHPEDISPRGPIYQAIADALERDIERGRVAPGERLPTHRDLALELGVNVVTITRSYREAARRGLVEGEVGRGTFVRKRAEGSRLLRTEGTELVDFHFNLPSVDPAVLDAGRVFQALAQDPARAALSTGYASAGLAEHREAGAEWISRSGLAGDPERTIVTVGAQHAMMVLFSSLLEPGDVLLTEALTYPGVKALAGLLHLRLVPVAIDGEGIVPEALEEACTKTRAKALYCIPTLNNPTGSVMPLERRERIAALAQEHRVSIIEDDTTGVLAPQTPPPLATLVPENVFFLSSTTKSLAGGLRVGYLQVPAPRSSKEDLFERIESNVAATAWMAPPLMAEIAATWIRDGTADRVVAWKQTKALERRAILQRHLPELKTPSHPASPSVWLPLPAPWRSQDFCSQAERRGVAVTAAEAFAVGRTEAPHSVRLCLSTPPRDEDVERGLAVIAKLFRAGSPDHSTRPTVRPRPFPGAGARSASAFERESDRERAPPARSTNPCLPLD